MDGLVSTRVHVDGTDATSKLTSLINECRFKKQLRAIFLDGIALGGFNVVDITQLCESTGLPVIAVIRHYPDYKKIREALEKLKMTKQLAIIQALPRPRKAGPIYVQAVGAPTTIVNQFLKLTTTRSYLPEPIRIAHIIGAGIVTGESKGRA